MRFLLIFAVLFALPLTVAANDFQGNCTITFKGSSTLHDFDGKARCQPFNISIVNGVIDIARLNVAIADMDTDNSSRDKKMREMFEENKYPLISGSAETIALEDIRALEKKGAGSAPKINFKLKIRDIVNPVTATIVNLVETDSQITADIYFNLSLADYRLTPPSVLGMIKVGDKIEVKASLVLNAVK